MFHLSPSFVSSLSLATKKKRRKMPGAVVEEEKSQESLIESIKEQLKLEVLFFSSARFFLF